MKALDAALVADATGALSREKFCSGNVSTCCAAIGAEAIVLASLRIAG